MSYINTMHNGIAEFESRSKDFETEYELSYARLLKIQIFPTKLNAKCKMYVSWKPDLDSHSVDAFLMSWKNVYFHAFLPFSKKKKKEKVYKDRATGILVVPEWPSHGIPYSKTSYL